VQVSADGRMHGSALFVIDGAQADAYVVADRAGGLHWVSAGTPGVECVALPSADATRPLVELRFDGAVAQRLPVGGAPAIERLRDAAFVLLAADTLGAAWTMIDRAVAYAHERRQFGRQIGSFQAVKHMCAEMAAELEITRSLIWYAAYAIDHLPEEAPLAAAHAKALLADVGRFVARTATEVHGGMGITDELGLHFWFKRIDLNRQLYGGPEKVRRHAANLQGLT
jgi:alkylation response protein AidB-like acyl-CoA dehydrogenase